MNIVLWILQLLLALWEIIGGVYMSTHYAVLASAWALHFFPGFFWVTLGILQIIFSLGLVASVIKSAPRNVVPISAIFLALISLGGIALYSQYSGFPGIFWGIVPALLLIFVAYERARH